MCGITWLLLLLLWAGPAACRPSFVWRNRQAGPVHTAATTPLNGQHCNFEVLDIRIQWNNLVDVTSKQYVYFVLIVLFWICYRCLCRRSIGYPVSMINDFVRRRKDGRQRNQAMRSMWPHCDAVYCRWGRYDTTDIPNINAIAAARLTQDSHTHTHTRKLRENGLSMENQANLREFTKPGVAGVTPFWWHHSCDRRPVKTCCRL